MVYKRFTISVLIQLLLILIVLFCIVFLFFSLRWDQYIYTLVVISGILGFQIYYLLRFLTRTNRELTKFIEAIRHEDYSIKYPSNQNQNSIGELHNSFNTIINSFQQVKIDRETQFNFLQLIIGNIEIGLMAINNKNEIVLMNSAAEKLIGVHKPKTWRQLKMKAGTFCSEVEIVFGGGKKLIEWKTENESFNLSIEVINTILNGQQHKLITINDIKREIEQKELDAWIKLIRVLNHEIMNSTTPISSLTETILMLLENKNACPKPLKELNEQVIGDVIGSIKTIQKRSEGLYNFVNEYRKLTKVPLPRIEEVLIKELIDEVITLMQPVISGNGIALQININPNDITILLDPNLIEQVLINLIKNAVEALEKIPHPEIGIKSWVTNDQAFIAISDNGQGIEPEITDEIFVPFFSTKEQGSGIGLSLSRQIMRLHGGHISVQSIPGKSTIFILSFRC